MKTLLNSSLLLILLMATFSIGITNAYVEEAKAFKTDKKIEVVEDSSQQYSMQSTIAIPTTLDLNFQESYQLLDNSMEPKCYAVIVHHDGTIVIYEVECKDLPTERKDKK